MKIEDQIAGASREIAETQNAIRALREAGLIVWNHGREEGQPENTLPELEKRLEAQLLFRARLEVKQANQRACGG